MIITKDTKVTVRLRQPVRIILPEYPMKATRSFLPSSIIIDPVGQTGQYHRALADASEIAEMAWHGYYGLVCQAENYAGILYEGVIIIHAKNEGVLMLEEFGDELESSLKEVESEGDFRVFIFDAGMFGQGKIKLHKNVIDVVDDEWRASLYPLHTPEQIAAHIALNIVVNRWPLSSLDGWADQPKENAVVELDGCILHL